ncbi:MAG: hypothetical protein Q7T90_04675 [Thiobacillus sp.]|nr:hypothetical protein [Thiobacillus sp.]
MVNNIQQTPPLKHANYAAAVQRFLDISQRYLAIHGTVVPALMHAYERERALFARVFELALRHNPSRPTLNRGDYVAR